MRKTRVFIWGSCVSRDTFEHLIPEEFELLQYVARQSALSAYTRPVSMLAPPTFASQFQQRQVTGDFESSLRAALTAHAHDVDMLLVDLVDERLGIYLLPDGTVITRSVELIQSGLEEHLPEGTQHLPFGSPKHFEYWTDAIAAVGSIIRSTMPRAAVVLLDIPWAERSTDGSPTPASFGVDAASANVIARPYIDAAVQVLGAHTIQLDPADVTSSDQHPWGESPFHYSENVYLDVVQRLTGAKGREVWNRPENTSDAALEPSQRAKPVEPSPAADRRKPDLAGPNFLIAGTERAGTRWLHRQLATHPQVFLPKQAGVHFSQPQKVKSEESIAAYLERYRGGQEALWRGDRSAEYFWTYRKSPFSPNRTHDTAAAVREFLDRDAPIILSLRDPVGRAISAYWNLFSQAKVGAGVGVFQLDPRFGVIDRGFYRRHYNHWAETLGASRITTLLFDDLSDSPQTYLESALRALQLDYEPQHWKKDDFAQRVGHTPWVTRFKRQNPIAAQEVAALLNLYMDDIRFIEDLLQRDLSAWRNLEFLIERNTAATEQ